MYMYQPLALRGFVGLRSLSFRPFGTLVAGAYSGAGRFGALCVLWLWAANSFASACFLVRVSVRAPSISSQCPVMTVDNRGHWNLVDVTWSGATVLQVKVTGVAHSGKVWTKEILQACKPRIDHRH